MTNSAPPVSGKLSSNALGVIFMILTFAVFVLYGLFAATAREWLLSSETAMRWMSRSFAAIFAALAVRLALEKA